MQGVCIVGQDEICRSGADGIAFIPGESRRNIIIIGSGCIEAVIAKTGILLVKCIVSAIKNVVAIATVKPVIACPGIDMILSIQAPERIFPVIASDAIAQAVACAVQCCNGGIFAEITQQAQVFNLSGKRIAGTAQNAVHAFLPLFDNDIQTAVHPVAVITGATDQHIVASTTVEHIFTRQSFKNIIGGITGQGVVQCVTGTVYGIAAGQFQIFQSTRQGIGDAGKDSVMPGILRLPYPVAAAVQPITIITLPACHVIIAAAAIQVVVAFTALQKIIPGSTLQRIIAGATVQSIIASLPSQLIIAG